MTTALAAVPAMLQAQTTEPVTPTIPTEFRDFAFEFKLGWDAGHDVGAICPILRSHMMAESRREAWKAGLQARRKALGIKPRRLAPLMVMRPKRDVEL